MPSMPSVPLMSASPSFGPSVSASMADASPSITSPSPSNTSAQWASGARSPLAPSEPYSGTRGVMPALSSARIASATSGRAPEQPIASVRARSSIIARTTSGSTGGPTPAACERTSARWSSSRRSTGIVTLASEPKPVDTP